MPGLQLGGKLGRAVLAACTERVGPLRFDYEKNDPDSASRLRRYFGDALLQRFAGKAVLDYGCGRGADAVAAALAGAARVVGIDLAEAHLEAARALAIAHGVGGICEFVQPPGGQSTRFDEAFDFAISVDAFEHFDDPGAVLRDIARVLRPGGSLIVSFGPPWKHPYGAHMNHFNRMPWIHMIFDEPTILAVRSRYVSDGARRFEEVTGGLNRMTVRRFETLIEASGFGIRSFETVPIWGLSALAGRRMTREFFTSVVRAELQKSLAGFTPA